MSETKLLKYLRKYFIQPSGNKTITPAMLSDSKGFCIQKKVTSVVEQSIRWWCESGRDSTKALEWLSENLSAKIGQHDNIALYIWIGTCDLTVKNRE